MGFAHETKVGVHTALLHTKEGVDITVDVHFGVL